MQPCNVIVFTADPKFKGLERFLANGGRSNTAPTMYNEVFQWDQKLHVVNFDRSQKKGREPSQLFELCRRTGGSFKTVESLSELRYRIKILAENSLFTVHFKIHLNFSGTKDENLDRLSILKDEYVPKRFYFDIGQKVSRRQNPQCLGL
jgi:hypothetical protein